MPITKKALTTRLDALAAKFDSTAAEFRIRARSEVGGAVALRAAIRSSETAKAILLPTADQLDDIASVLASTPAFVGAKNAAIAMFDPRTTNPILKTLQGDATDAIVTGVIGLGARGGAEGDLERQIDALLKTVLSVDDTSRSVRDLFSGRKWGLAAYEIPKDLLDRLEKLQGSTCYSGVLHAMNRLAAAVYNEIPRFGKEQQILSIKPIDACPGDVVRLAGVGFGAAQMGYQVMFTGQHGRAPVIAIDIRAWSDTAIEVVVPVGAGRGPVGIATPTNPNSQDTVGGAASELAGELSSCVGEAAHRAIELLEKNPVLFPRPPESPTNFYRGGPPEIQYFMLEGRTGNTIWPNGDLTLSWKVDGATEITITPERVGNQPNELPLIPGGQPPAKGSYKVANIPGSSRWSGEYRLVARNQCGTHEATAMVVMARRVGFALSGGGSRGAFQVGALDYLYNVKGIRPDGIASTSVGSVNALQLIMGDLPTKNAVEQLKDIWLELQQSSGMWVEEAWLKNQKQVVRGTIQSFGWWTIAFFPFSLVAHIADVKNKIEGLDITMNSDSVRSFFNLSPIEAKMLAVFSESRVKNSGIAVRFIAVSLKTGEIVKVNEQGSVLASGSGTATLIKAAIASSIMPGIFPAERLGDHFCVDGGIREIIPVQYCIDDMGTNQVYAIACSARTLEDPRQNWRMTAVMTRSMMDINFDEIVKDDTAPHGGWPEGVVVRSIFPRLNIFDPIMIEPGLIRIAMDYGWMCAADELDTPDNGRGAARLAADQIVQLRLQNWADRYTIENVMSAPDPHSGFLPAISNGFMPPSRPAHSALVRSLSWYPPFLQELRDRCRQVRARAAQRLAAGGALPPTSVSWWQAWETIPVAAQLDMANMNIDSPWIGITGQIATETPPARLP